MNETETAVAAVRDVGPDTVALDLQTPPGFDAHPGQFVKVGADLGADDPTSRFYTISSPNVGDQFEITVEVDPEGELGPWLADRAAGDRVRVAGPFGNDYYEGESRVIVLAGGPGIGPAVGIAERAVADGGEAAVVYRDDDPVHADRLGALRERDAYVAVVGEDEDLTGAVAEALDGGGQAFVYGFAEFLDAATTAIADAGGDPDGAKIENFG